MKREPSISPWSMAIFAGLTAAGALAWFSYSVSQPEADHSPATGTSPSHASLSAESAAAPQAPTRPPAAGPASSVPETDQHGAEPVSWNAGMARKQAELRTALNAAAGIADLQRRNETLAHLCYHWAEIDPRGAVSLAMGFHLEEAGVLENLTLQWASADLSAARAWIDAQPGSDAKARLVARIGFLWAQAEPEAAANYVIDETPPGEIQTEAAISVLHQWAQQDRYAAIAWAQKFPAGELRERALKETLPAGAAPDSLSAPGN